MQKYKYIEIRSAGCKKWTTEIKAFSVTRD